MGRRHQARELALKVLFELESGQDVDQDSGQDSGQNSGSEVDLPGDSGVADAVLRYRAAEESADADVSRFAENLVRGVRENAAQLDELIAGASTNWRLDQMSKVDRIILRIAAYEITHEHGVPVKAAINESIELAKTFSGEEAGRFVNGVLGKIAAGVPS